MTDSIFKRMGSVFSAALNTKHETLVSGVNIKTFDSMSILGPGDISTLRYFTYDSRSSLRNLTTSNISYALVEGLGLFCYKSGSDEPDDDESCFATSTGRWILEAMHWDVIDNWQLPDTEELNDWREDTEVKLTNLETNVNTHKSKTLFGTANCTITSVASVTAVSFTGTIVGANIGDRVYVNPPAMLGNTESNTGKLSFHSYISAYDTVTIQICNASASTAFTNTEIQTTWKIIVFKD